MPDPSPNSKNITIMIFKIIYHLKIKESSFSFSYTIISVIYLKCDL